MPNVNVTSMENLVRGYVISHLSRKFPGIDISEHSSFDDTFVKPMVAMLTPVFRQMNALEMRSNLENAPFMSDEDLNRIMEGNYLITRNHGSKGSTTLILTFLEVTYGDQIIIPINHVFETKERVQFHTTARTTFPFDDLPQYYNSENMTYELPVFVESVDTGAQYNVAANTITESPRLFHTGLISVTNPSPVTNATSRESNFDYAQRGKNFYISRHLGTRPGYEAFVLENFEEVTDVFIVGYQDEFMERDKIMVYDTETETPHERHIGGMTDIYVTGCLYVSEETVIPVTSNYLQLEMLHSEVDQDSITVFNLTESEKEPVIQEIQNIDDNMVLILANDVEQSFNPNILSEISVFYRRTDPETMIEEDHTDTFMVGKNVVELRSPLAYMEFVRKEDGTYMENFENYFSLEQTGDLNTTEEQAFVELAGFDETPNGEEITVGYTINSTLRSLKLVFNQDNSRIITADIKCLETGTTHVNIAFKVKLRDGVTLDSARKSQIRASVANYLDQVRLRTSFQESDIVSWLYNDVNVMDSVEYVQLPFEAFYLPVNQEDELTMTRDGTSILIDTISHPALNRFEVQVIGGEA